MRITYGTMPKLTESDCASFSRGKYTCKALMQDERNMPIVISQYNDPDLPVWKVEYGFSCMCFATREEAMDYCNAHFKH